jgi:hypothetical protein
LAWEHPSQEFGNVVSFHLDEIKHTTEQQAVTTSISNLGSDTMQTIFLFALPQVFVNHPVCWRKLLDLIIQQKVLCFVVAVDVHFAHSFCQEFDAWLKPYISFQSCSLVALPHGQQSQGLVYACCPNLQQNNSPECGAPFWPEIPFCQHLLASVIIAMSRLRVVFI